MSSDIATHRHGVFVISLDFELHWGVVDRYPADGGTYRDNLLNTRCAINGMLDLFDRYEVGATWATVGLLFARTRMELRDSFPNLRPTYERKQINPYSVAVGEDEADDPLHFARSVIDTIARHRRQEIASHTFSHFNCFEPGQTLEQFQADLDAAVRIAANAGITLKSMVFPRNQVKPEYLASLSDYGFTSYRGTQPGVMYNPRSTRESSSLVMRGARLADAYVPLVAERHVTWDGLEVTHGVVNIPASRFLRPCSSKLRHLERVRLDRIRRELRAAARDGAIYHLWWHPHNFGANLEDNLSFLEAVLTTFRECSGEYGMRSMTMTDLARGVLGE